MRRHFLLPRLVADELHLLGAVMGSTPPSMRAWEHDLLLGLRDVVCGMPVRRTEASPTADYDGVTWVFCSPTCRRQFRRDPRLYTAAFAHHG